MTALYWLLGVVGYLGIGVIVARLLRDAYDDIGEAHAVLVMLIWPLPVFGWCIDNLHPLQWLGRLILYTRKERR